jgi:dihydrofolate reductase
MTKVYTGASMSLDWYISGPGETGFDHLFAWYNAGDIEIKTAHEELTFHVTEQSAAHWNRIKELTGALVVGRKLFDFVDGWGGTPIVGDHVFVVTHRDAEEWRGRHPDAPYTFCTDVIEDAVRRAGEHAGDGTVLVCAGEVGGQVVAAGLADELAIDLAPVFLGQGKRFLGSTTDEIVLDDPSVVVQGERVLHLRYRLRH